MNCKTIIHSALIAGGFVCSGAVCAETATAVMLANTCAGCHGTNGSSVGPSSPTIAGMSRDYFIESMDEYKSGKRPSTIMTRIAKGYTEKEIELMADFFSKQEFIRRDQEYDQNLAMKGSKHHKRYCEKCHENGGRSAEDDAGILAGQWMPYLTYTMDDYLSGSREMGKKMKKKCDLLMKERGEEGMKELIQFYGSQK
jgi:sulfide dehydrogenase cytochrome subunit